MLLTPYSTCSIQYHTAIIQLLQPLLHIDHFDPKSYKQLLWVVVNHAKIGMELLTRYKRIYSNFYLSPLQLFCLVNLADAVVLYDGHGDSTPRTVEFCLTSLEEAKAGYPVAAPLQKMFCISLTEYGISISDELERMIRVPARMAPEQLLDACTRPTYRQPIAQITHNMEEGLGQAFMDGLQRLADVSLEESLGSGSSSRGKIMDIRSLLNL